MSKTVLISLAAVVALIVIVVYAGMRYLRADDEDNFDEEMAAEHGRSGDRGGHPGRDHHHTRPHHTRLGSHHDGEVAGRTRAGASVTARSGRGDSRPDQRGAVRTGQDRRWREDSDEMSRGSRAPQRDQHLVTTGGAGRHDHPDISEPIASRARPGRSQPGRTGRGGLDDFDGQPGSRSRNAPARDYDRDTSRDSRERRGGYKIRDARDGRQSPDSRDRGERREPRPAASMRQETERDRRGATRPNARPDASRNGAKPDREALPAVKPRQGKNRRDGDGDWPTTEWDELSDVDYWAELASDKPLTPAVPAGDASRAQRREPRQDNAADVEPSVKHVSRREHQPERAIVPALPPTASLTGSDRFTGNFTGNPVPSPGRSTASRPVPDDDDPLTSPSFPRITTEDSRSYRRTRAAASESGHPASHSGPMPAIGSDYAAPVGYPASAIDHAAPGYARSVSASYQMPAPGEFGGYPAAADPLTSASYPAGGPQPGGYSLPGGVPAAGYLPSVPATEGNYGGDIGVHGAYPGQEPAGFRPDPGQLGQATYQNSLPPSPGYQTTGSYSFPGEPATYEVRHTDQPGGYYQAPEAGYRAEGHRGAPGAAVHGPLPGGHADPGYPPAYQAAVPGSYTAPYPYPSSQSPVTQPPGYPEYGPGSYDPASQAARVPESPEYAAGDPYGPDLHGFPGYGGSGY